MGGVSFGDDDSLAYNTVTGTWSMYFDGSDVGLSTNDEDIDALGFSTDGKLLISTLGSASVIGISAADEDLVTFAASSLGSTTSGTWSFFFDGSDVGLSSSSENIAGAWIDPASGDIYLTTVGSFSVPGASGDSADIFICTPSSLGTIISCTFTMYWDGSAHDFGGEIMDAFEGKR